MLDVGCGTGEHTLMAAGLGLDATGVDLASRALRTAEAKARPRAHGPVPPPRCPPTGRSGRAVRYRARLRTLPRFDAADRGAYVDGLRSVLPPGGPFFMLCFSDQEQGAWGRVHKVTRKEIKAAFAGGWRIDSVEAATIDITTDPDGIRAWLTALTRI